MMVEKEVVDDYLKSSDDDASFAPVVFHPGDVVETCYGVGVLASKNEGKEGFTEEEENVKHYEVLLWRNPGKSICSCTVAYLQANAVIRKLPAAPGMITTVKTSAAASSNDDDGRISGGNDNNNNNNNNIKERVVLVKCYYPTTQTFLVSPIEGEKSEKDENENNSDVDDDADFEDAVSEMEIIERLSTSRVSIHHQQANMDAIKATAERTSSSSSQLEDSELQANQLDVAPSAKFYPLLHELIKRGEQTAAQVMTSKLFMDNNLVDIVDKTTGLVQMGAETVKNEANRTTDIIADVQIDKQIDKVADEVQKAVVVPTEDQVQKILQMLKDEELTVLLQKGKDRLEQLVATDIPEATKLALEKSGIRLTSSSTGSNSNKMSDEKIDESTMATISESLNTQRRKALETMELLLQNQAELMKEDTIIQDLQSIMHGQLNEQFTIMFDTLSDAAKSDRTLSTIFDTISIKTTDWQRATGRLLQTKSANLFLEGASRIQQRAAGMFAQAAGKQQQNAESQWFGMEDYNNIASKLTKAFTEGDAAVARLKSIELGDAVRTKLVEAIEVRSESIGGLDGIIAGALSTIKSKSHDGTGKIQDMIMNLQDSASAVTKNTNETLIAILSRRTGGTIRDVALLQLEQTLCDLERHFNISDPELIASLARGEGGTAQLFEPIANRAATEIQKLLDAAEESAIAMNNPTVVEVLKRVRKIVSGELTVNAILDEVVTILNDDQVVAASETLVKHGENVLDVIEGATNGMMLSGVDGGDGKNNNIVTGQVMETMKKAGITKDTVMKGIENLNVNQLLDTAGEAVTDEKKRKEIVSLATDTALDFFLRILPSLPIPPFDGVKDGLMYQFSNLSMEGFQVKKECVMVEIAGMRATRKRRKDLDQLDQQEQENNNDEFSDARDGNGNNINNNSNKDDEDEGEDTSIDDFDIKEDNKSAGTKATELLIIDIKNISARFFDAAWGFEQTYMPYLKGNGKANILMMDGAIRLQFELRKRRKPKKEKENKDEKGNNSTVDDNEGKNDDNMEWEPVLCLHDRTCSIGEVNVKLQGEGRLTWIINKLASIFKGALRDYVVRTIVKILTDKSGWMLEKLNNILSQYWALIMSTAQLNMDDLLETNDDVVVAAAPSNNERVFELVWTERVPLGLNLLLNDQSGLLKIVDFPRGSQARLVCERKQLDPEIFKGATIVGVNGCRYSEQDDLFEALKDPARPKAIAFEVADTEEINRIMDFVNSGANDMCDDDTKKKDAHDNIFEKKRKKKYLSDGRDNSGTDKERKFNLHTVKFTKPGQLGIEFVESVDNFGLVVSSFIEGEAGTVLAAERTGKVQQGDLLTHIDGELAIGENGRGRAEAMKLLESIGTKRPLSLTFTNHYFHHAVFFNTNQNERQTTENSFNLGGPHELVLEEKKLTDGSKRIAVQGFEDVGGVAESSGILIGDHLAFINGAAVGAGCRWTKSGPSPPLSDVYSMLKNDMMYPIGLTFARPQKSKTKAESRWSGLFSGNGKKKELNDDEAETICVSAERFNVLGCIFDSMSNNDIVVTDLYTVSGVFQEGMKEFCCENYDHSNQNDEKYNSNKDEDETFHIPLSIESINGQVVPSYATISMVKNAMKRSWSSSSSEKGGKVELLFCDDEKKRWLHSLATTIDTTTTSESS